MEKLIRLGKRTIGGDDSYQLPKSRPMLVRLESASVNPVDFGNFPRYVTSNTLYEANNGDHRLQPSQMC